MPCQSKRKKTQEKQERQEMIKKLICSNRDCQEGFYSDSKKNQLKYCGYCGSDLEDFPPKARVKADCYAVMGSFLDEMGIELTSNSGRGNNG